MSNINLHTINKVYPKGLPDMSTFFNSCEHSISRHMLRKEYNIHNNYRAFKRLNEEYTHFLVTMSEAKKREVTKNETK